MSEKQLIYDYKNVSVLQKEMKNLRSLADKYNKKADDLYYRIEEASRVFKIFKDKVIHGSDDYFYRGEGKGSRWAKIWKNCNSDGKYGLSYGYGSFFTSVTESWLAGTNFKNRKKIEQAALEWVAFGRKSFIGALK